MPRYYSGLGPHVASHAAARSALAAIVLLPDTGLLRQVPHRIHSQVVLIPHHIIMHHRMLR